MEQDFQCRPDSEDNERPTTAAHASGSGLYYLATDLHRCRHEYDESTVYVSDNRSRKPDEIIDPPVHFTICSHAMLSTMHFWEESIKGKRL